MPPRSAPIEVGIILRPNMMLGIVHGLTDLFRIANDVSRPGLGADVPLLRTTHYADTGACGIVRVFDTAPDADGPDAAGRPAVLIVPPCQTAALGVEPDRRWADWLTARHAEGCVLGSICGGAFLLAQTGLLDGRRATTHILCAPDLAAMYPAVRVDIDALLTEEETLITVGGVMAWTDLGLVIVRRLLGRATMMETARFMMIDPPGRQQRFYKTFAPDMDHGDAAILKAQWELQALGPAMMTVAGMAAISGLETRTFMRRFRSATGLRPNEYHQRLRVESARERLETSLEPVADVAAKVGYVDPASFRRLFTRVTGLSPQAYRKRFGHAVSPTAKAQG